MQIGACSPFGDPRNPAVWSGTPSHIVSALEGLGLRVDAFSTAPPHSRYYYALRNVLTGLGYVDTYFAGPRRLETIRVLERHTKNGHTDHFLHFSTCDMPLPEPLRARHYLYIDYTFDLHVKHAPRAQKYTRRFVERAGELEAATIAQLTHIFTTSEYVRENLITSYGVNEKAVTAVGTGLGLAGVQPPDRVKDYSKKEVLFVARHSFVAKGGELVLRAWQLARQQDPGIGLTMVVDLNDGATASFVRNVPDLKLLQDIPFSELLDLFQTSTLFALPALHEPWGLVYLEALACRTPVLGLRRNALPEITQNGAYGFLAEPTPESVAAAMLDAFSDPQRLQQMSEAGQHYCVEKYSWPQVASAIAGVMQRGS